MTRESARDEIRTYMGKEAFDIVDNMSAEELEKFGKLINVQEKKSYVVKGQKESLDKFEAYYLFQCSYNKPFVGKYMLMDYIEALLTNNDEEFIEKEVMILYSHDESFGIGNAETLFLTTILEKVATRARRGGVTIILAERTLPLVEKSDEVTVIDLDEVKDEKPFMPPPKVIIRNSVGDGIRPNYIRDGKKKDKGNYVDESGWGRSNKDDDITYDDLYDMEEGGEN